MRKTKSPAELGGIKLNQTYSNSASSQRARLLESFSKCPRLTTMEARNDLGVLHPPGRIMELRRMGHMIDTHWVKSPDCNGVLHRIGQYVYHGKTEGGIYESK
jgi:hypothetical protein